MGALPRCKASCRLCRGSALRAGAEPGSSVLHIYKDSSVEPFCLIPRCLPSSKAHLSFPLSSCQGCSAGYSRSSCDLSGFSLRHPAGEDQKSPSMATRATKTPTSEQHLKILCMTGTCSPRTSWPTRRSSQSARCARLYSTVPSAVSGQEVSRRVGRCHRSPRACHLCKTLGGSRGSKEHPERFRLPRRSRQEPNQRPHLWVSGARCRLGQHLLGTQWRSKPR